MTVRDLQIPLNRVVRSVGIDKVRQIKIDEVSASFRYVGITMHPNCVETTNEWIIYRETNVGADTRIEWADDDPGPVHKWSERGSKTYKTAAPFATKSADFDGVDDFVNVADQPDYTFGNGAVDSPFSVSLWFKLTAAITGSVGFIGKDGNAAPHREWAFAVVSDGEMRVFIKNAGGSDQQSIDSTTKLTKDDQWHHAVCTYDGSGGADAADGLSIYLDGVKETPKDITKNTYTAMTGGTAALTIGQYNTGGSSHIAARMCQVAVWDKELSQAEIDEIYNSGTPVDLAYHSATANIVSWWPLGDAGYPTATDEQAVQDGTYTNMDSGDMVSDAP